MPNTAQLAASLAMSDGSTQDVTATATWVSANPAIATVSAAGLVTGVAVGATQVTATAQGKSDTANVIVDHGALVSIALAPATANVAVGATQQLTATGTYEDGSTAPITTGLTWASSAGNVATVSATGLVTGVAAGTANITATRDTITSSASAITVA